MVVFREFNIPNSFTLECSFFGKEVPVPPQPKPAKDPRFQMARRDDDEEKTRLVHLTLEDKRAVGRDLIQVLQNYLPDQ